MGVKERKGSGFLLCGIGNMKQRHQLRMGAPQKNKYGLEGGSESMSQFWIWWLDAFGVGGSWKYRCGASAKG